MNTINNEKWYQQLMLLKEILSDAANKLLINIKN